MKQCKWVLVFMVLLGGGQLHADPQPWDEQVPDLFSMYKGDAGYASIRPLNGDMLYQEELYYSYFGPIAPPENVHYLMGDYNHDRFPDLYAIIPRNTGSGMTEVHVLDGQTSFQRFLLHTATGLPEVGDNVEFHLGDMNRDGHLDLVAIEKGTHTGAQTVYNIFYATYSFQGYSRQGLLPLNGNTDGTFRFALADYNRDGYEDIYAIKQQQTGTHSTEIHVLSGGWRGFRSWILQTGTPLHETDDTFDFLTGDYDRDGYSDLYVISKEGQSNTTEVHVLNGATSYQTWMLNIATDQAQSNEDYDFTLGKFVKTDLRIDHFYPTQLGLDAKIFHVNIGNRGTGNTQGGAGDARNVWVYIWVYGLSTPLYEWGSNFEMDCFPNGVYEYHSGQRCNMKIFPGQESVQLEFWGKPNTRYDGRGKVIIMSDDDPSSCPPNGVYCHDEYHTKSMTPQQ